MDWLVKTVTEFAEEIFAFWNYCKIESVGL